MTIGNKKPRAYIFNQNAEPQFNLLPDAEPMDYFSLFCNDELLNNIVYRDRQVCETQNFRTSARSEVHLE
jgi:hypothetical protein